MLYRGFKIKSVNSDEFVDSSEYNLTVKSLDLPMIASKRNTKEYVMGRDGSYNFIDGFNDKIISLQIEISDTLNYSNRRYLARNIAKYLSEADELILNYEKDKIYKVNLVTEVNVTMLTTYDSFTVVFDAKPLQKTKRFAGQSLKWNEADIPWNMANFPWAGYETNFTGVTNGSSFNISNNGTYKALPLIKLTGTATSVTLTDNTGKSFTYTNLSNESVYIDCDERLVYKDNGSSKTNKRSNFTGKYIALEPGDNVLNVTGIITTLSIEFIYKDTYL